MAVTGQFSVAADSQTPPVAVIRRLRTLSGVTDHDDFVQEHEDEAPPSDEQATPLPEDTPPQPWSTAPAQEAEQRAGQHAQQWPGESLPEPEQSAGQHAPPQPPRNPSPPPTPWRQAAPPPTRATAYDDETRAFRAPESTSSHDGSSQHRHGSRPPLPATPLNGHPGPTSPTGRWRRRRPAGTTSKASTPASWWRPARSRPVAAGGG